MNRPEEALHRQVAAFLAVAVSPLDCHWHHCPNGGGRSKAEAGILKALGTRPGVADLEFVLAGGRAAFIELKAEDGRLSPAQKTFRAEIQGLGAHYAVCRSLDEVAAALRSWGVPLHAEVVA